MFAALIKSRIAVDAGSGLTLWDFLRQLCGSLFVIGFPVPESSIKYKQATEMMITAPRGLKWIICEKSIMQPQLSPAQPIFPQG